VVRLYDYAASGNCYKVRLLLGLLGRQYDRVPVDIFAGDTLTAEFARLNPARETPVLELSDGAVVVQSNAILCYLAEGTVYMPADALGRAQVAQWLHFEQERIMRGIGAARFFVLTGRQPQLVDERRALGATGLDMLEAQLDGRRFLVGDHPTVADIANFAYTSRAADAHIELDRWPAVQAWLARVRALPGFVDDYIRYPDNARPGRGRSIYG
jgi:glutathione S-transferase